MQNSKFKIMLERIEKLIASCSTAVLCSVDENGYPCAKAMLAPRRVEGVKEIWFSTNTSSQSVERYRANDKASVYFYDAATFQGVMLRGVMEVRHDAASKEALWQEGDEVYYPQGVTDPDYCVLRFVAENARFYADFHSEDIQL